MNFPQGVPTATWGGNSCGVARQRSESPAPPPKTLRAWTPAEERHIETRQANEHAERAAQRFTPPNARAEAGAAGWQSQAAPMASLAQRHASQAKSRPRGEEGGRSRTSSGKSHRQNRGCLSECAKTSTPTTAPGPLRLSTKGLRMDGLRGQMTRNGPDFRPSGLNPVLGRGHSVLGKATP